MRFALAFAALVTVTACGPGPNNVAACKALVNKLNCGTTTSPISTSTCDGYQNSTCDISEYFTCLEAAYVCVNGQYDTTKLQMASACAAKAVCK